MTTLNPKWLSKDSTTILNAAAEIAKGSARKQLYPEVVLLAMIRSQNTAVRDLLERFKAQRGLDLDKLERSTKVSVETRRDIDYEMDFQTTAGEKITISRGLVIILDEALSLAQSLDEQYIDSDHLLAVMAESKVSTASILRQYGITPQTMTDIMADKAVAATKPANTVGDVVATAKSGTVRAVYFREKLLADLTNMLAQRVNRNVILIGPDGVGKRTLVYSLGLLMAEGKGPTGLTRLIAVEERDMLDDPSKAIADALKKAQGGIIFISHIERFFGGLTRPEWVKASPLVQKALLDDTTVVIGTTTQADFDAYISRSAAVIDKLQALRVPETTEAETIEIIKVLVPHINADYKVKVTDDAIKTTVQIAKRYMSPGIPLPRSAEQLLHRACAVVNVSNAAQSNTATPPSATDVPKAEPEVDAEDVTLAAAQITGIPVAKLGQDERTRYASMVEHIHERIVGQDEAVLAVSRAVKTARVGLKDPKRPIGSFLFLGPTGVGKTELAKALAEFLFNSEDAMLEIDMSEYMDDGSVNKLIGAPPGYVGYEGGGQLTDRVRTQPYIVVLFDEVEKANQRVMDVLLQVLEAGRLTDGQGRVTQFSESVIILTSNLGASYLQDTSISEADREGVMGDVREFFRPEFLNRLDEIVIFHPLSETDLKQILGMMLKKESKMASDRGLTLDFTEAAQQWMMAQNDHPEWGARPLRRIITRFVRVPLADYLLSADPKPGTTIKVDAAEGATELVFATVEPSAKPDQPA